MPLRGETCFLNGVNHAVLHLYPDVCTLLRKAHFKVVVQMGPFLVHRNYLYGFPILLNARGHNVGHA